MTMIGSRTVTLRFSLNWLLAVGGLAVLLVVLYATLPAWRLILVFTAPVVGGAAALIAAFNALEARAAEGARAKKAVALDFIHRWVDPGLRDLKQRGRGILRHFQEHPGIEEQTAYVANDPARLADLLDVLNIFENLAIAIRSELADEEIARRFFRTILLEYWHSAEAFIKTRRAERQNTVLYRELEWLFDRWRG